MYVLFPFRSHPSVRSRLSQMRWKGFSAWVFRTMLKEKVCTNYVYWPSLQTFITSCQVHSLIPTDWRDLDWLGPDVKYDSNVLMPDWILANPEWKSTRLESSDNNLISGTVCFHLRLASCEWSMVCAQIFFRFRSAVVPKNKILC